MGSILMIYDEDKDYVMRLGKYINNKRTFPFTAYGISNMKDMEEFCLRHNKFVSLINNKNNQVINICIQNKVLYLGEKKEEGDIYKYQSAELTMKKIMEYFPEYSNQRRVRITGIYTPVSKTDKSITAILASEILAKEYTTLYVNLEDGMGRSFLEYNGNKSLSDILYCMKINKSLSEKEIKEHTESIRGFDYIPAVNGIGDIAAIRDEWEKLTETLVHKCGYERIVLQIGDSLSNIMGFMELVDEILLPVKNRRIDKLLVNDFKDMLYGQNSYMSDKIKDIFIKDYSDTIKDEGFLDRLMLSDFGKEIREALDGRE